MGIGVSSHSSSIEEAQADRVRRKAEREGLKRAHPPVEVTSSGTSAVGPGQSQSAMPAAAATAVAGSSRDIGVADGPELHTQAGGHGRPIGVRAGAGLGGAPPVGIVAPATAPVLHDGEVVPPRRTAPPAGPGVGTGQVHAGGAREGAGAAVAREGQGIVPGTAPARPLTAPPGLRPPVPAAPGAGTASSGSAGPATAHAPSRPTAEPVGTAVAGVTHVQRDGHRDGAHAGSAAAPDMAAPPSPVQARAGAVAPVGHGSPAAHTAPPAHVAPSAPGLPGGAQGRAPRRRNRGPAGPATPPRPKGPARGRRRTIAGPYHP